MVTEVICLCTGKGGTNFSQYLADTLCLDLHYIPAKLSSVVTATQVLAALLHLPINPSPSGELFMWEKKGMP